MVIEHTMEQRSEEWYNVRAGIITSSVVSSIMAKNGLGKGADTLCMKLADEKLYGIEDSGMDTFHMQRGRELEPHAFKDAQRYLSREFKTLRECGFFYNSELNSGSSPDGVISDGGLWENKAPERYKFTAIQLDPNFEPENSYFMQMQHQMLVTGSDYVLHQNYAIRNSEGHSHYHIVERCEYTQEIMRERLILANAKIQSYYLQLLEIENRRRRELGLSELEVKN